MFYFTASYSSNTTVERSARLGKRDHKNYINAILEQSEIGLTGEEPMPKENDNIETTSNKSSDFQEINDVEEEKEDRSQTTQEELLKKLELLEKENVNLKRELQEKDVKSEKLINENKYLLGQYNCMMKNEKKELYDEIKTLLSPYFTDTQISLIVNKKSGSHKPHWTFDDVCAAISLHSISPKCYKYLKEVKNFPLPSVSTLNRYARSFKCEPGLLVEVISLLRSKCDTLKEVEKISVISFDEMSIASEWSYDKGSDTLYKPYNNVQVIMLRGLIGRWKQPIFYDFDESNLDNKLLDIITEIENAGYIVVAIVHDLGPTNLRIWKKFGIDPVNANKVSFKNPCADREIFVFADAPHMLKLLRNNLIDSGFFLETGKYVSTVYIEEILKKTKDELKIAHKISEINLNVSGTQRQRVQLAACLLSKSCAHSIKYLGENEMLEGNDWEHTSNFFLLVNDWFDVMNSSGKYGDVESRNAFGVNIDSQIEILDKMSEEMKSMRVQSKKARGLYPFQKGIILSCQSLKGLYEMLQKLYKVEYIITRRLNQDVLEHFFGCIRQMSGNFDHPNPVSFKYRLRKFLLGKEVCLMSEKCNSSRVVESVECISSNDILIKPSPCTSKGKSPENPCITPSTTELSSNSSLSYELCLTSMLFKDFEFDLPKQGNYDEDDDEDVANVCIDMYSEINNNATCVGDKIEDEALKYIGGYMVKKFINKYPNLGTKECSNADRNTWIKSISRGNLYYPSEYFYSQLLLMRTLFKSIHAETLQDGKECLGTLVKQLQQCQKVELPHDLVYFFAKISVFFFSKSVI